MVSGETEVNYWEEFITFFELSQSWMKKYVNYFFLKCWLWLKVNLIHTNVPLLFWRICCKIVENIEMEIDY